MHEGPPVDDGRTLVLHGECMPLATRGCHGQVSRRAQVTHPSHATVTHSPLTSIRQ